MCRPLCQMCPRAGGLTAVCQLAITVDEGCAVYTKSRSPAFGGVIAAAKTCRISIAPLYIPAILFTFAIVILIYRLCIDCMPENRTVSILIL